MTDVNLFRLFPIISMFLIAVTLTFWLFVVMQLSTAPEPSTINEFGFKTHYITSRVTALRNTWL